MPTKEQLEEKIEILEEVNGDIEDTIKMMTATIADKDNEIKHLQYGNEQLRKSLYDLGGKIHE